MKIEAFTIDEMKNKETSEKYDSLEECIFGDANLLLEPFQSFLPEEYSLLLKQLLTSYRTMISECLGINTDLRAQLDNLKKKNVELIFESNLQHFKEAFYLLKSLANVSEGPLFFSSQENLK